MVKCLAEGSQHVPFRESKLTMMLQKVFRYIAKRIMKAPWESTQISSSSPQSACANVQAILTCSCEKEEGFTLTITP